MMANRPPGRRAVHASVALLASLTVATVGAQDSFGGAGTPPTPAAAPVAPAAPALPQAQARAPASSGLIDAAERADAGVSASDRLHAGAMHGPTPAAIPGGRLVTTQELAALLDSAEPPLVFDVLGGPQTLPGALHAVPAHQPGDFQDRTQREFGQWLQQQTQGRLERPLVFYCASTQCWMSYNAALRAIHLGYRQVLWYRGGIQAWKAAGLSLQRRP